ncbi:HNH endonuclease family protein [Nocardia higoensis]|uniref:HNH endonuclease family protein n=1 Tax=Nocardia higoensis TaxID=228599 RepID=UPI0002DAE535|nr:HNH endonuclease family protein [Nocardia higoensis]
MKLFSSQRFRRALGVIVPALLAAIVAGAYAVIENTDGEVGNSATSISSAAEVENLFSQLKVAKERPMDGYSREEFPHWDTAKAEHGFGDQFSQYARCTTREVMMLRDAEGDVTLDAATCALKIGANGGWRDEYGTLDRKTGALKPYKWITDPSGVDAEHIVALAEAWRSGADRLDKDTRRRIANDALNLEASDPTANRSKGDQDAANYLPPGKFRCAYVDRYLRVKVKYGLTVDTAEQAALRTAVDECTRQGGFR